MNIAEKIVESLLSEEQMVVIQFVSPNNTFFWYTGHAEHWTQNEDEARPLPASEAADIVARLEQQPNYRGRIGTKALPGYAGRFERPTSGTFGASGRV